MDYNRSLIKQIEDLMLENESLSAKTGSFEQIIAPCALE